MTGLDVLGIDDAALMLDIPKITLRRLAADGRIPARKVGREWRFGRQAILDWLAGTPTVVADEGRERDRAKLVAVSASFVGESIRQAAR